MGLLHSCLICDETSKNKEYISFQETAGGSLTRYICKDCFIRHHAISKLDVT
jgi:hypothetical protein